MKVIYKNKKIEKLCTDEKTATKEFGQVVAFKLLATIEILESAENLKDILLLPQYKLHQLKGDKNGIFSMYLGRKSGYRLLIIPLDKNEEKVITNDMRIYTITVCVEIIEVSKHYE